MTIIGIDPGKTGGCAIIRGELYYSQKMPDTRQDLLALLRDFRDMEPDEPAVAFVEKLGGMPRDEKGKAKQSPTTMFKMGMSYGQILMALTALEIRIDQILASQWQQSFGLKKKWSTSTVKKNAHKQVAADLFPSMKMTHAISDALLIAEFGRRAQLSDC